MTSNDPVKLLGHKRGQCDLKVHRDLLGHNKVTATSNDPETFWRHKLGHIDNENHRDLLDYKLCNIVGDGDLL